MRQKRSKTYRKLMHLYCMTFGFRQPYQILVDSEMCKEAVSAKIDLAKQLQNVLHGSIRLMITQCSISSLYISGRHMQPVVDLAKTLERRKCNHREAQPEEECIKDIIGKVNKHRYVVATQTASLRQYLRSAVPGVPLVHIKRSVMILEPVSAVSEHTKVLKEEESMRPTKTEAAEIKATVSNVFPSSSSTNAATTNASSTTSQTPSEPVKKKKRKGPKGPNPLSVKKKKKKPGTVEREWAAAAKETKEKEKRRVLTEARDRNQKGRRKEEGKVKKGDRSGKEDKEGEGKDEAEVEAGAKAGMKRKREAINVDGDQDTNGTRGKIAAPASGPTTAGPPGVVVAVIGKRRMRKRRRKSAAATAGGGGDDAGNAGGEDSDE